MITFYPNIGGGCNRKYQQEQDKAKCLEVVGCNPFNTKEDSAEQLALGCVKSSTQHICHTPIVLSYNRNYIGNFTSECIQI
jgi:hypothetical protein